MLASNRSSHTIHHKIRDHGQIRGLYRTPVESLGG